MNRLPRRASRPWPRASALLLSVLATACGAGNAAERPDDGLDPRAPGVLYPLLEGRVWSYDVDTGDGVSTLAITRVLSVRGTRVEVSSGSDPVVYEVDAEGIRYPGDGGWLLRAPVTAGREWTGRSGRRARVVEDGFAVEVPAGRFDDCVKIQETDAETGRQIDTTYCPRIGPVEVVSQLTLEVAGGVQRAVARLLGTNLEGDLDSGLEVLSRPAETPAETSPEER